MYNRPINVLPLDARPLDVLTLEQFWQWSQARQPDDNPALTHARLLLNQLFENYTDAFALRLWNGQILTVGEQAPTFTITLTAALVRDRNLLTTPMPWLAAYIRGDIQVLGDLRTALQCLEYFQAIPIPMATSLARALRAVAPLIPSEETKTSQPESTTHRLLNEAPNLSLDHHAPAEFYRHWLDERMLHSCAYFCGQTRDLSQAQQNQLDLICLKLRLQHGNHLLDLSGGWGGLACWAAKHYGVFVHAYIQNPAQYAYASKLVQSQQLSHLVTLIHGDYRDLTAQGEYDKAVCIGVAEHVGEPHLPAFLNKVHAALTPGGLFLSHGMTNERAAWQPEDATHRLVNQQLYPQGNLASFPQLLQCMDAARFEVFNVEGLRQHFVQTLRHWLRGLESKHHEVTHAIGERSYRAWRLYMTASLVQFEQGLTGIHQIVATRR